MADDGSVPKPDPGAVLNVLGMMYKDQGRMAQAAVRYERSIALGAAAMRAAGADQGMVSKGVALVRVRG